MTTPEQIDKSTADQWPPGKPKSSDDQTQPEKVTSQAESANQAGDVGESPAPELLSEVLAGIDRAEGMAAQGFQMIRRRLDNLERRLFGDVQEEAPEDSAAEQNTDDGENAAADAEKAIETAIADDPEPEGEVVAEVIPPAQTATDEEVETFPEVPPTATPVAQPAPVAQPVPQPTQPVREVRPAPTPASGLSGLLFGDDLHDHPSLPDLQRELTAAWTRGEENAMGLAGQILIVRSATMDRLPTLLKDVGEAWFRWQMDDGTAANPLRDALITWLHARLDAVGLGNRIELVRVGDRFDSKRHNAKSRGVNVTGVHGWVVLRDNGSVYTKATVTVA